MPSEARRSRLAEQAVASLRWTDLRQLRERLLDDVLQQVADTGRPAAGQAAVRLSR